MTSQLYLTGRLFANPEIGRTKRDKVWVKVLLETELVRPDGRGGFQTENVVLPISFFSREAEAVKDLRRGDPLVVGTHLYGTEFQTPAGEIKRGVQIIADAVTFPAAQKETINTA
jgi:single-stranded DNA-binding protein